MMVMKFSLLLLTFFSCATSISQTGGVAVRFELDPAFEKGTDSISVQLWRDSTLLFKGKTIESIIAREIPSGKVDLYCAYRDSFFVFQEAVYIQPNQLVYKSFEVDSSLLAIQKTGAWKFSYSTSGIKGNGNYSGSSNNRLPKH
jgi:hypothetical protein